MKRKPLNDVIILLPGITASVLHKDGKDVWAISGQAAVRCPFLNETPSPTREPLYRVYHASFQDFLTEQGVGLQPYHERIVMTALAKIPRFLGGGSMPS